MVTAVKKHSQFLAIALGLAFSLSSCGRAETGFEPGKVEKNNAHKLGVVEATTDNEMVERLQIINQTSAAVKAFDFAALDKMAYHFRSTRALTPSGTWKLSRFYHTLESDLTSKDQLKACKNPKSQDFFRRWIAHSPKEPAAHIMSARLGRQMAWCIRGGAYAANVPKQDMEAFTRTTEQTYRRLDSVRAFAAKDPQFYVGMINLYPDVGANKSEFISLINEAINAEPYYYDIYWEARRFFEEKWLGDAGDLQRFDKYVTEATEAGVGKSVYARIHWVEKDGLLPGDPAYLEGVDWPMWRAGMRDIATKYPDNWNLSNFSRISCDVGKHAEARYFFERMTTNLLTAWRSEISSWICQQESGFKGDIKLDKNKY
jgi:hypothetical protein